MAARSRNPTVKECAEHCRLLINGDGCTVAPDLWFEPCCNQHDLLYVEQTDLIGQPITRKEADEIFFACLQKRAKTWFGKHVISRAYFYAVRVFGQTYWNRKRG